MNYKIKKMKRIHYVGLALFTLFLLVLSSCNTDDGISPRVTRFAEISDIATFHGNLEANIVVINTQGGPITQLDDEGLLEIISNTQTQSALFVNVHQAQTKDPSLFTDSDITFEQAKQYDLQSVDYLKRVVDFFKNQQGKTVYVLGISFGAFMTQELIAKHGIDVADSYLIMVGRLDIDENTWKAFSKGEFTGYEYDTNGNYTTITNFGQGQKAEDRNTARLAAGLGYNRYTERLQPIRDLSKITYIYGMQDDRVGPLSNQEQFLEGKKAEVISFDGNHVNAADKGLELLKEKFGIE